ncbi:DUF1028 domain-containing protein [Maribacter sp. 2307UL18-2]|uniref:DUF1028 domain-containing protein n=1 Tax=Maribacter sp. 2307UL18-2 TaxID=3386274 RepID=UPI0039BD0C52
MKKLQFLLSLFSLSTSILSYAQNLPSLLTEKDINSTFSILAFDEDAQEWGIAVATDNIYVGNSTIYIEPGLGAFSVIAETEPRYAKEGLEKLKNGKSIEQAIGEVKATDDVSHYRQVSGIDANGKVFAFTGQSLHYWKGKASQILGDSYVVMGNQLADDVLSEMSKSFESSSGALAERLLESLIAGQKAGGQISGKQSAALVVKGTHSEWFNQIDLRVDHSKKPIEELKTLLAYHYGRIRLNQALYAKRNGNVERATQKLTEAETMLEGWTGMYARIAGANILMGHEDVAVDWIKKGLNENPNWSVNLPAFYMLRHHPDLKSVILPDSFGLTDWESAIGMLSNLGKEPEAITLAKELIAKKVESSYLNFLLGRSYFYEKEKNKAITYLERALKLDPNNIEAENLLDKLRE